MGILGSWDKVAGTVAGIIDKVVPDRAAAAAATATFNQLAANGQLQEEMLQLQAVTSAQTDINKVEAASTSLFVAGWRPYVGWICGTGLAMSAIVGPLFTWLSALCGHPTPFPIPNDPLLESTLAGMLGMGHVLRTVEKVKGVVSSH
jgi:hypothetical protein